MWTIKESLNCGVRGPTSKQNLLSCFYTVFAGCLIAYIKLGPNRNVSLGKWNIRPSTTVSIHGEEGFGSWTGKEESRCTKPLEETEDVEVCMVNLYDCHGWYYWETKSHSTNSLILWCLESSLLFFHTVPWAFGVG